MSSGGTHDCPNCNCPVHTYRTNANPIQAEVVKRRDWTSIKRTVQQTAIVVIGLVAIVSTVNYGVKARTATCLEREEALRKNPMDAGEVKWWKDNYEGNSDCSLNGSILSWRKGQNEIDSKLRALGSPVK